MPSQKTRKFTELLGEIKDNHASQRAFAQKARLDKSLLNRLINGQQRRINPATVSRIELATAGRIGMAQFLAYGIRLAAFDKPSKKKSAA